MQNLFMTKYWQIPMVICILLMVNINVNARIVFTPTWTPQAQFAGYYVAKEKGFFKQEGVDVVFNHLKVNTRKTPSEMLENKECNVISITLIKAIIERMKGMKIVNILQAAQNTALLCVSQTKLSNLQELQGCKVGTWSTGHKEIMDCALKDARVKVQWIPFTQGVNLFVTKAVDAILCYSYNEYIQLLMSCSSIPQSHVFSFERTQYNLPGDGLYVTEQFYNTHRAELQRFVKACKRGWDYCRTHRDEAVKIVMKYTKKDHIVTNAYHQRMMLDEVLRLQQDYPSAVDHRNGDSTYAPISRTTFNNALKMVIRIGISPCAIKYEDMIKPL